MAANAKTFIVLSLKYINMLKSNGPKKWIFEEYCNLSEMQFRFKDKDTPLSLGIVVVISLNSLSHINLFQCLALFTQCNCIR